MLTLGLKGTGTLGDACWLTPVLKSRKDVIIQMHDDLQCHAVASIFDNLAKVEHVENPPERLYITNTEKTHAAQRILNSLNIKDVSCIPQISLLFDEIEWAKNFLSKYENPIIFVNDNSGSKDPNNARAHYVRPPIESMQDLADEFAQKYTILQLDRINKYTPLKQSVCIENLSIRQIAACYHVVGKMVGGDTGNYHLMMSVGGKALISIPEHSLQWGYDYDDLLYFDYLWKDEKPRVKYFQHRDNIRILDYINFDF